MWFKYFFSFVEFWIAWYRKFIQRQLLNMVWVRFITKIKLTQDFMKDKVGNVICASKANLHIQIFSPSFYNLCQNER